MKLRKKNMEGLSEGARQGFEDRMVAHLAELFTDQSRKLGETGVRQKICEGIERASGYDIGIERDVCIYIELMFAFGRDFDSDPCCPWAGAILNEPDVHSQERARRLHEAARNNVADAGNLDARGSGSRRPTITYDGEA